MNIKPSLDEIRAYAETGLYNIAPVSCELLSDIRTPIELLKVLKNISTHCYMLESVAEQEKWGRYTFLGYDPKLSITCVDGQMQVGNLKFHTDNPSDNLRQILEDYKSPRIPELPPFTGGLVGYFLRVLLRDAQGQNTVLVLRADILLGQIGTHVEAALLRGLKV